MALKLDSFPPSNIVRQAYVAKFEQNVQESFAQKKASYSRFVSCDEAQQFDQDQTEFDFTTSELKIELHQNSYSESAAKVAEQFQTE